MRMKPVLTLDDAKKMLAAGEAEAIKHNWGIVMAILDDAALLVALHKMDGARPGNPEIAIQKARTSALTQRSSKVWEDWVKRMEDRGFKEAREILNTTIALAK